MRILITAFCLCLLLAGCMSRPGRPSSGEEIQAWRLWLPAGAAPGMFITWSIDEDPHEPGDPREETLACVGESAGLLTMERRETLWDGSARVTAARFRPDGELVEAWRGPRGGIGHPIRVSRTQTDWKAETDALRAAHGLPRPDVSSSIDREWVDTPAGRVPCVRATTTASMLVMSVRSTTWHATSPLPLSSLVKFELQGPVRSVTTLKAFGTEGADPTLSIPESGR